jgi:hypothetical protein
VAALLVMKRKSPGKEAAHVKSATALLRSDPTAKLAMALPKEVPVSLGEIMEIMKGSSNPNAALLLAGWLAGPDGQRAYDQVGRGSPYGTAGKKRVRAGVPARPGNRRTMRLQVNNRLSRAARRAICGAFVVGAFRSPNQLDAISPRCI